MEYKFNEEAILQELKQYIDATYEQHYAQEKIQAMEFIDDSGFSEGFCLGSKIKYIKRYGKKGTPEDWRKDLIKDLHYGIIMLSIHDSKL